jgi:hypothetical protein
MNIKSIALTITENIKFNNGLTLSEERFDGKCIVDLKSSGERLGLGPTTSLQDELDKIIAQIDLINRSIDKEVQEAQKAYNDKQVELARRAKDTLHDEDYWGGDLRSNISQKYTNELNRLQDAEDRLHKYGSITVKQIICDSVLISDGTVVMATKVAPSHYFTKLKPGFSTYTYNKVTMEPTQFQKWLKNKEFNEIAEHAKSSKCPSCLRLLDQLQLQFKKPISSPDVLSDEDVWSGRSSSTHTSRYMVTNNYNIKTTNIDNVKQITCDGKVVI